MGNSNTLFHENGHDKQCLRTLDLWEPLHWQRKPVRISYNTDTTVGIVYSIISLINYYNEASHFVVSLICEYKRYFQGV